MWTCSKSNLGFHTETSNIISFILVVLFGGLVVIVLATVPKVRGLKPSRGRLIFKGDKENVA
jgi:hypothetical protein